MRTLRRIVMLLGLLSLGGLTVLAIVGAFVGAEDAAKFFNSRPLTVFWAAFAVVLIIGVIAFKSMARCLGLVGMHVGCVLVIAGAIWGSDEAHRLREARYNEKKLTSGSMMLVENRMTELANADDGELHVLDFQVRLDNFRVEHYPPADERWLIDAIAHAPGEQATHLAQQIDWEIGKPVKIPFTDIELTIVEQKKLSRPRIRLTRGDISVEPTPTKKADEEIFSLALLYDSEEQWESVGSPTLILQKPYGPVRDEVASLAVVADGRVIERAEVSPNHPMHYGGYHFYLAGYTPGEPAQIWLKVVSDTGLVAVYIGFVMICLGAVWRFWIRPIYMAKEANG